MATSWGTRKAFGRRYGQDPAVAMELERLKQVYSLAPAREARAEQARQFNQSLAQQQSQFDTQQQNAKMAGITGTVANLGATGLLVRGMTKGKDEPFFGRWGSDTTTAAPVAGYNMVSPELTQEAIDAGIAAGANVGVNPATIDAVNSGISAGADVGMGTATQVPSGFVPGPGTALALAAASRATGNALENQPWAPNEVTGLLKHPVTGAFGESAKLAGKATGVKEIGNVGTELERIEDQVVNFISDPIGSISNVFGGW